MDESRRTRIRNRFGVGLLDLHLGESGRPDRFGTFALDLHLCEPASGRFGLGALGSTLAGERVLLGRVGVRPGEDRRSLGLGGGGLALGVGFLHRADETLSLNHIANLKRLK